MTAVKRVGDILRMQCPGAPAEAILEAEQASQDGPEAGGDLKRARWVDLFLLRRLAESAKAGGISCAGRIICSSCGGLRRASWN